MANKLIDAIQAELKKPECMNQYDVGYNYGLLTAKQIAIKLDALPVVRCKNCVHMAERFGGRYCKVWTMFNGMGDEGYCNYGERKTDYADD